MTIQFRILRRFTWNMEYTRPDVIGPGCGAHSVLQHTDTLQFRHGANPWVDVPIVEEPKPESPDHKRERIRREEMRKSVDEMLAAVELEGDDDDNKV